MGFLKVLEI